MVSPKLRYDIELDTKKAQLEAKGFAGSLGGIKGALTGLATVFAASEIIDYGKHLFNVAAAAEETDSAIQVVLGGIKNLDGRIASLANSTLLTVTQTKDLVTQLAVSNKSLGLNSEAAFKVSEHMIKVASDIASFRNAVGGTEEVLRDLRSAQLGNYEAAEKWIGSISDAIVKNKALEMGLIRSKSDGLDPYTQQMVVLQIAIENMAPAMGDMERTMDSSANAMRSAIVEAKELEEKLAQEMLPTMNFLTKAAATFFEKMNDGFDAFEEHGGFWEAMKFQAVGFFDATGKVQEMVYEKNVRLRKQAEQAEQNRMNAQKKYVDRFMQDHTTIQEAEQTAYTKRKSNNEDLLASYGKARKAAEAEVAQRKEAAAAAKRIADQQREIAKAQEEAARAAEKYAKVVKDAEKSVLNTYETVNELTKDQGDIRSSMAERIARELMDTESKLTDKQVEAIRKKFGVSRAEIDRAKAHLNLSDLEQDLIRSQERIDAIEERKKQALREQVAELNKVLDVTAEGAWPYPESSLGWSSRSTRPSTSEVLVVVSVEVAEGISRHLTVAEGMSPLSARTKTGHQTM